MRFPRFLRSLTIGIALPAAILAGTAGRAAAIDYHRWYWTTVNDPNPLPFSECVRRANAALTSQGFAPYQSGTNPVFVDATAGAVSASILCIQEPRGFHMTLLVMSDDQSHSSVNVGKGIRAAFWGTTAASAEEGVNGVWDLTSTCVFVSPNWSSTITLYESPSGALRGSADNDALTPAILPDANQSFFSGNTLTLVLHPADWAGVLNLTGQLNGSTIAGKVHHNGSDDCTFSMVRS